MEERFHYVVEDDASTPGSAESELVIRINGANDGPVAANDDAGLEEDGSLFTSGNVLGNDSDVDAGTVLSVRNAGQFTDSLEPCC